MNNPDTNDTAPIDKQRIFSLKLSLAVFIDFPPYSIMINWMRIVLAMMIKNIGLLKKFLNMLIYVRFSFLALSALKICKNTKTLNKME